MLDECDDKVTNEDVAEFLLSKVVQDEMEIIKRAEEGETLSLAEYCHARDIIMMMLMRYSGQRPGVIQNATMGHYARRQRQEHREVICVPDHKRKSSGPAPLQMNAEVQGLMTTYVEKIRPQIGGSLDPSEIFLKKDCQPFTKGTVGRRLTSLWIRSGVRPDVRVSATLFRKWIITTEREKNRTENAGVDTENLRKAMSHTDAVAKKYYVRESLTSVAVQAAKDIEWITQPDPDLLAAQLLSRMSQEPLTDEEQDAVKEAFRRQIQSGSILPMKEVAATMKKHPVLQKIAKVPGKVKRVTDKIRSLIRVEPRISPQDLPELAKDAQTASWVMAPTVSGPGSVRGAKLFTDEENKAIEARFRDHSKPPGVQQLRKIFQEDPTLRPIFEKYTFQQCKDKVKNYIKEMNRKA